MKKSYSKEEFNKALTLAYFMGIDTGRLSDDPNEHDIKFKRDRELILLLISNM